MTHDAPTKRRSRIRVSLRGLMLFVTLVCVVVGIHFMRVRTQRDAVRHLRDLGVSIYDHHYYLKPLHPWETKKRTWPPQWLVNRLGIDHFSSVEQVMVEGGADGQLPIERMRNIVEQLRRLPYLKRIHINQRYPYWLTDQHFGGIAKLSQVESLDIQFGQLDSRLLAPLADMTNLKSLHFKETDPAPDNGAFRAMASIRSLKTVWVPHHSKEQKQLLARLRPDITLSAHGNYAP